MRLLLDENIPAAIGGPLMAAGFDVRRMADVAPRAPDDWVLAEAERESEVLVTADKDFGELVYLQARTFHGVVLIRLHPVAEHSDWITQVLVEHATELAHAFIVIAPNGVRLRRHHPPVP